MGDRTLKKLPMIAILREAIRAVAEKRFVLFRGLIGTILVLAVCDVAFSLVVRHVVKASTWGLFLLSLVVYMFLGALFGTLVAVTCHRIILLGESSVPKYGLHSWTSRETRFLGWSAVLAFFMSIAVVPFGIGAIFVPKEYRNYLVFLALLPAGYLFARFAVLLPSTAVGERHNTDWAWNITANNGWRLFALLMLAPAVSSVVTKVFPTELGTFTDFLSRLLGYVVMTIEIVVLSLSFRFLMASQTPQPPAEGT